MFAPTILWLFNKGFVLLTILLAEMRLQWHAEVPIGVLIHVLCCCYQEFPLWNETSKSSQVTILRVPVRISWFLIPSCEVENLTELSVSNRISAAVTLYLATVISLKNSILWNWFEYSMTLAHLQWTSTSSYTAYLQDNYMSYNGTFRAMDHRPFVLYSVQRGCPLNDLGPQIVSFIKVLLIYCDSPV